ncbi:hypothetical protein QT313_15830 [Escherichia coli]|nr:hypothetical protein [Escherichia coli]
MFAVPSRSVPAAADKAAEEARFRTLDILHVSALGVQALRVAIPALIVSCSSAPIW